MAECPLSRRVPRGGEWSKVAWTLPIMKVSKLSLLALGFATTLGCASIEDFNYRAANRWRASSAWRQAKACLPVEAVNGHFADGFKEGYFVVSTGGTMCPPVTPPPLYWKAKFQSTEGQYMVGQWYQGYQAGAIAADRDGRSIWHAVPTQDGPGFNGAPCCISSDIVSTDTINADMHTGFAPAASPEMVAPVYDHQPASPAHPSTAPAPAPATVAPESNSAQPSGAVDPASANVPSADRAAEDIAPAAQPAL